MNSTTDGIHVPIKVGSHRAAPRYAPMVCTANIDNRCFVGLYALTSSQEIQMPETRPFFNVQVTAETGAATTTGMHPMSAAIVQTPMISSRCPRGFPWPL